MHTLLRNPVAIVLALAAALLIAVPAATALADCGGVYTAKANKKRTKGRPPLALGDSTMILSVRSLGRVGYKPNAHGCRQYPEAIDLIRRVRRDRRLPRLVLVALGANGNISGRNIEGALNAIGPKRRLILVTQFELGGHAGHDAQVVRRAGRRHPTRIKLMDWVAHSSGHSSWFQPDGLHMTFEGAAAFTKFLSKAVPPPRRR